VTISGQLLDRAGKGLSGQLVQLWGNEANAVRTDRNGNFAFTGVRAGANYRVMPPQAGQRVNFQTFYPNPGWVEFKNVSENQRVTIKYELTSPWTPPDATPTPTPQATPTPTPVVGGGTDGTLIYPNFDQGGTGWLTGGAISFTGGVARLAPTNTFSPASLLQWVKLTAGATYEASVNALTSASARTVMGVRFDNGEAGVIQVIPAAQARGANAVLRFTLPANAAQAGVYVQVNGSVASNSWAQVDNFQLRRVN
jgi:hypothetical protein